MVGWAVAVPAEHLTEYVAVIVEAKHAEAIEEEFARRLEQMRTASTGNAHYEKQVAELELYHRRRRARLARITERLASGEMKLVELLTADQFGELLQRLVRALTGQGEEGKVLHVERQGPAV